ncbi:IS3 family transposase [bacterium]|nr:IS3 family transposase [bacterium]MDB4466320.1 IS3 family transposase [bacterium]
MIKAMRTEYSVTELCDALGVSQSGYYKWCGASKSPRASANEALIQEIKAIHKDKNLKNYGSPRMVTELNNRGYQCSENRVARLMALAGVSARHTRKWKPRTTIQNRRLKPSPNLLKEVVKPSAAGQIWVSDITYVFTRSRTYYLAVVMDLFTRQIVGWELDSHTESSLVERALKQAENSHTTNWSTIFLGSHPILRGPTTHGSEVSTRIPTD